MLRKLLTLFMGVSLTLVLAACGGGSDNSNNKGTNTDVDGAVQKIVSKSCNSCHGVTAPALEKNGSKYSKSQILDIIKNGKNGGKMPGGLITGNDADRVATWLAAKK